MTQGVPSSAVSVLSILSTLSTLSILSIFSMHESCEPCHLSIICQEIDFLRESCKLRCSKDQTPFICFSVRTMFRVFVNLFHINPTISNVLLKTGPCPAAGFFCYLKLIAFSVLNMVIWKTEPRILELIMHLPLLMGLRHCLVRVLL